VVLTPVYPALSISAPIALSQSQNDPGRWYLAEQTGRLVSWSVDGTGADATTVIDLSGVVTTGYELGLLGLAFHPTDAEQVFLSYNTVEGGDILSRISRFALDGAPASDDPQIDPASEEVIYEITQPYDNHNGGQIAFGPDGYLYISLGDGGSGGDPLGSGQDPSTPLGAILRIDPDTPDGSQPYSIPGDNPFKGSSEAEEIYAWGLRNPWRFTFDPVTGDLWAGDVGQSSWEEVDRIERGGNYGWNLKEGTHCYSVDPCDVGGLIDPVVEYENTKYASVVMGPVYRGSAIPGLQGAPLFSDFFAGNISHVGWDTITGEAEIVDLLTGTGTYPAAYGTDAEGEVYLLDYYAERVLRLDPAEGTRATSTFPQLLSETGCMDETDPTQPGPGLIPYGVQSQLWSDGAQKDRWFALPDGATISVSEDDWELPVGSVVVKNFHDRNTLVETRLLVRHDDGEWAGYSYAWIDSSDATWSPAAQTVSHGEESWTTPSSADCLQCHTSATGRSIGLETAQLNGDYPYPDGPTTNQLDALSEMGVFDAPLTSGDTPAGDLPSLDPLDATDTAAAARSYLHSNCAHCHQPGGPGLGELDLRWRVSLSETGACDTPPTEGGLGLSDARLIAPGAPERSVLLQRMLSTDANRMPPLATSKVHAEGTALIEAWITGLEVCE